MAADLGDPEEAGIAAVYPLADPDMPVEESMARAAPLLAAATENAVREFLAGAAPDGAPV